MKIAVSVFLAAASLWACAPVDGPRIRGVDLAAVSPAFAAVDPAFDFGPAPMVGIPRVFRAAELVRLGQRAGLSSQAPPEQARPEQVCFQRAAGPLDPEALLPVLRTAFDNQNATIEILDFSRNKISHGRLEFVRAALTSSGMWRGRVLDADGHSAPVWVRVRLSDTATGEVLRVHEVERGDSVRVEVASGPVLLVFDAAAETAGRTGESILVKNLVTGRRFRARVESKGKVIIQK